MDRVISTILAVSFSGTVLAMILFASKPILKRRTTKAFSYYIWLLVLLRLVIPFGYGIDISRIAGFGEVGGGDIIGGEAATGTSAADIPADGMNAGAATGGSGAAAIDGVGTGSTSGTDGMSGADGIHSPNKSMPHENDRFSTVTLIKDNLGFIWIFGVLVSIFTYAGAYILFSRRLRRSFIKPHDDDAEVFDDMRGNRNIRLACSSLTNTPMLIGIFKPVIVLPERGYCASGMRSELQDVFSHELTHYRRHDIAYKWLTVFATGLHWFNPAVYFIRREIDRACELSCDEGVIWNMDEHRRKNYGNTLLSLASKSGRKLPAGAMATTMCDGKKQLKGRLMNIMSYKRKSNLAIALTVVFAVLLTGCAAGVPDFNKDKDGDGEQEQTQSAKIAAANEAYKAVLNGKAEFLATEGNKKIKISEIGGLVSSEDGINAEATKFSVIDLDGDAIPEVVLVLQLNQNSEYGVEILRYREIDSEVYGYTLSYRSFMNLKADGTFSFSGGAADNGFGKASFTDEECLTEKIAYSESAYDEDNNKSISFFVDGEAADEEKFNAAINAQGEKADAERSEFTSENIERILGETEPKGETTPDTEPAPEATVAPERLAGAYPLLAQAGETLSTDLDGDGKTDYVAYNIINTDEYSSYIVITVNGTNYAENLFQSQKFYSNSPEQYFCLTDIDNSDGLLEIAIMDAGSSSDYTTSFFHYENGTLSYIGKSEGYALQKDGTLGDMKFFSDGTFSSYMRLSVFQTWYAPVTMKMTNEGIAVVPQEVYTSISGQNEITALVDLTAYASHDTESERTVISAGTKLQAAGTDNEQWVRVVNNGTEQWLHLKPEESAYIEKSDGSYMVISFALDGLNLVD